MTEESRHTEDEPPRQAPVQMEVREELRQLAVLVGSALSTYIEIHDWIFQEGATFKSVVKNLFGKGVPMSRFLDESKRLLRTWSSIQDRLNEFRSASYQALSRRERAYFDLLSRYVAALLRTMQALVDRQQLLYEGSLGGRNSAMTRDAVRDRERVYRSTIEDYQSIGRELNATASTVFD